MRWTRKRAILPEEWNGKRLSAFQRQRLKESVPVAIMYLRGKATVIVLSVVLKVTHQRVAQIVKLGTEVLLKTGRIRRADG